MFSLYCLGLKIVNALKAVIKGVAGHGMKCVFQKLVSCSITLNVGIRVHFEPNVATI